MDMKESEETKNVVCEEKICVAQTGDAGHCPVCDPMIMLMATTQLLSHNSLNV